VGKVQPKPARDVAVAAALGLILGVVAGLVREQFDRAVRGTEEAEEAFGQRAAVTLPPGFLGYRPFGARRKRKGLDPVVAELAIQRLAANILWSTEAAATRTLLVTSAHPEEGKTTIAANLAVELASAGHRVIVVEADLRRPKLQEYLDCPPPSASIGIDAVLRGRATITAAMVDIPVWDRVAVNGGSRSRQEEPSGRASSGRLRAILAAPGQTWPSEFGQERIEEVLSALKSRAEYVIFDAPPILVVPDAYPLVTIVDAVVAVVRNDKSTAVSVEAMSRLLRRLQARRVELVVTEAQGDEDDTYHVYTAISTGANASSPRGELEPEK
jgi:Mrp family chromosome partitioning ATPase